MGNFVTKIHTRIVIYMRVARSAQTTDNQALLMTSTPFVRSPHDRLIGFDTEQSLLMNTPSHSDVRVLIPIYFEFNLI